MAKSRIESFFKITLIDKLSAPLKDTSKKIGAASKVAERAGAGYAKANSNVARSMGKTKSSITDLKRELSGLERKRDISVDVSKIQSANKRIRGLRNEISKLQSDTTEAGDRAEKVEQGVRALFGGFLAFGAIRTSVHLVNIAKEAESTRVAINTLLKDTKKGEALYKELNEFANVTPFSNTAVINASRTLLALKIEAKDIIKTLRVLGDVSSGVQTGLEDMALAYGKIKTAGAVRLEDINPLIERGVPILEALGVVAGGEGGAIPPDVVKNSLISGGKLRFEHVKLALENLTAKGGHFYSMMITQSNTLNGKLSTLRGILEHMMIQLGTEFLPIVKDAVDGILRAVQKSKNIVSMTVGIAKALMEHKTALMLLIPLWSTFFAVMLKNKVLTMFMPGQIANVNRRLNASVFSVGLLTGGIRKLTLSFKALMATMRANRIGLILTGITLLISGISALYKHFTKLSEQEKMLKESMEKSQKETVAQLLTVKTALEKMYTTAPGTEVRKKLAEEFRKDHPAYLKGIDLEKAKVDELRKSYDNLLAEMNKTAKIRAYMSVLQEYEEKKISLQLAIADRKMREDIKKTPWWKVQEWFSPTSEEKKKEASVRKNMEELKTLGESGKQLMEIMRGYEKTVDPSLYDANVQVGPKRLTPFTANLGIASSTGRLGLDGTFGGPSAGVSNDVHATVTGGRQPLHLSINIENALNISEFNSYSADEDEEIQDRLIDAVSRAINEGARRAQPLRSHHG